MNDLNNKNLFYSKMGNCATDCKNCTGDGKEFVDSGYPEGGNDVRTSMAMKQQSKNFT